MQLNYRINNIELRTNAYRNTIEIVPEIVQWSESMCWVIVSFHLSKDTARWNAQLVEDRPFHPDVNWKHLKELIAAAYKFLNGDAEEVNSE